MAIKGKVSRKDQLTEIATLLFREKGYTASSMRDIANKLGIEAASIYSHIKSKEEILRIICFRMADAFFEALENVENNENKDIPTQLEKSIIDHVLVVTKDTAATQVFINEWKHLSEPYLKEFISKRDRYEGYFIELIRKGISNGCFKKVDEKTAVLTILSSLNWIANWYKPNGKLSPQQIGEQICSIVVDGLRINGK